MKRQLLYTILTSASIGFISCGDKKDSNDSSSDGKAGKAGKADSADNEKELKGMLDEALLKEFYPNLGEAKINYVVAGGYPMIDANFEIDGKYHSVSITKGVGVPSKNVESAIKNLAARYPEGEMIDGIGDIAYLNRKLRNISVKHNGNLYHLGCREKVSFNEEKAKAIAKKLFGN